MGIPVITEKVDIAHARIEFATGTVANVTASRVSTERVRKMRFFQEHEYISLDFARQDVLRVRVQPGAAAAMRAGNRISKSCPPTPEEPLRAELARIPRIRAHAQASRRGWRRGAPRPGAGRPRDGRHPGTCAARPTGCFLSAGNSMIPRTLVPSNVRPVTTGRGEEAPARASTTYMDDRTVVPSGLSERLRSTARPTFPRICRSMCWSIARLCRAAWRPSHSKASDRFPKPFRSRFSIRASWCPARGARRRRRNRGIRAPAGDDAPSCAKSSSPTFSIPATRTC